MSDPAHNLVLAMSRMIDRVLDEVNDSKGATSLEDEIAGVHLRPDRLKQRVERIERRLDPVVTHH